ARSRGFAVLAPSQKSGWHACYDREWGHVLGHNGTGSDDAAFADRHTRQKSAVRSDIRPLLDAHRANLNIRIHDRNIRPNTHMLRSHDLRSWSTTGVIAQHEITSVEI